jgi:hypothetical protein
MAINKVGSKGIEDGSVATVDLAPGSVTNPKLANSSFTFDGTSVSLGASESVNVSASWQSVITADGSTGTTAVAGNGYFIDTTSAAHTLTLPASATIGDFIAIKDYAGTFATNNLTIARNGHNIQGVANDSLISTNRASLVLVYVDSTKGWLYWEEHNVANLQGPIFITATGGTITESGDFKIHTFTGDGCFVVSTIGNSPTVPTGGPTNVDYLVVAGGGGGGSNRAAGGGAGGYRTTFPSPGCNAGAFPISATTYPITVGSGGAGGPAPTAQRGVSGSNSIFSSITSTGGGAGGSADTGSPVNSAGLDGGSGGGSTDNQPVGSGNTPPVSPSQGNPGGINEPSANYGAGGGGGAAAAGSTGTTTVGGAGGTGSPNAITGSAVTRAGGGGGGIFSSGTGGSGGDGGGGAGAGCSSSAVSGTVNTGGGGGGGHAPVNKGGGAGGKGIVIIRYKFQ